MISKTRAIHLDEYSIIDDTIINLETPKYIYLATKNARCSSANILIQVNDTVKKGQVIALRDGGYFTQPVHSTVSGIYLGVEKHYHRSGKPLEFMKIENDFKEELFEIKNDNSIDDIYKLDKDTITEIIKNNSLVGLGGSSFPTYIKFQTKEPIDTILINAVECEPLIKSDHVMMMNHEKEILDGINIVLHAFNAKKAMICYKKKYKDITLKYSSLLKDEKYKNIKLCGLKDFYPQGWEIQMIKNATGINIKSGVLPSKYGIMDFNVSTIYSIYLALIKNISIMDRYITVSGNGISNPSILKVRCGTPLIDLINKCGGYADESKKVLILGGPMMGASIPNDDAVVTKTVTSLIVLNKKEFKEEPCIRCGSCSYSCPVGLMPMQIMNAVKTLDRDKIKILNANKCIECGLCAYSCTSKINVTDFIKRAKLLIK